MHHLSSPSNTHGTMAARTLSAPLRSLTEQSGRVACLLALTGMSVLAGCQQSPARQDSYTTPLSTCAYMMPTVSGTRTHGYRGMPGTTPGNNPVESAVAYSNPQTPAFCDRPLPDTLRSALELADYTHLLDNSGLLATLQQTGPFTVFALPNAALEQYNTRMGGNCSTRPTSTRCGTYWRIRLLQETGRTRPCVQRLMPPLPTACGSRP